MHFQIQRESIRKWLQSLEVTEPLVVGISILFGTLTSVSLSYGIWLILIGFGMLIWCGGHTRPGRKEQGDVSGPWLFVRHPDVVARFLVVFGIVLISCTPLIFGAAILLLGTQYRNLVRDGDLELSRWLGPSFAAYRLFVPSFLPQFIPARLPQGSMRINMQQLPWSSRRILQRKQMLAVLFAVIAMVFWSFLCVYLELNVIWFRMIGLFPIARGLWLLKKHQVQTV